MADLQTLKSKTDILTLVENDLGAPLRRTGKYTFWNCPFHGEDHTPSLSVTAENGRWWCFGCRKGGDIFSWMQEYHHLPFKDALRELERMTSPAQSSPPVVLSPSPKQPSMELQACWKKIITVCQENLWSGEGDKALRWLEERGLKPDTLRTWRIGYATGSAIEGIPVQRGIIIPCYTTNLDSSIDQVSYIKIRRPEGDPKYINLSGGVNDLYGYKRTLSQCEIIFVTEGEFDCLLLWQEGDYYTGGGFMDVCTFGSAAGGIDFGRNAHHLLKARHVITVFDNDAAGEDARQRWESLSPRVKSARVPDAHNDLSDYWKAGGNLFKWMDGVLAELGILGEFGWE